MAYMFGAGVVTINSNPVGTLQDVSLDVSFNTVPLMGAYQFPVALARGAGSVKGSAKSGEFDSTLLGLPVSNELMAAPTTFSITWAVTPQGGSLQTFTLAGCIISSWKLSGGNDRWLATDITFEASAAPEANLLSIA